MRYKIRKLILILSFLGAISCLAQGQLLSTKGKEFWGSFMRFNLPSNARIFIYITSEKSCTGSVENRDASFSKTFSVSPETPVMIELPLTYFYTFASESINTLGFHVQATDSVSLFAQNDEGYNLFEVATIFPVASLGSDYIVLTNTRELMTGDGNEPYDEFMIVGVEDGTIVELRPTQSSSLGTPSTPFTITLNKGQTYLYKGKAGTDLTGSEIHVLNDCKKIAVFSGAPYARINECLLTNHLFEQCPPLNTLGTQFLLAPTLSRSRDDLKITATQNNTDLFINNILIASLDRGQSHEQYLDKPMVIHASRPVMTAVFGVTENCSEGTNFPSPYMMFATPLEQAISSSSFNAFNDDHSIEMANYINICTRTAFANQTVLDGRNIGSQFTVFPADPVYSYARIPLENGAHVLANPGGYTANEYGYGKANHNGYGLSVGSSLNKSNQFSMVNGISSNLQKEFYFCPLQTVKFEAIRQDTVYSKVYWFFSDGGKDSGNVVNKNFAIAGCYTVQMISYYTGTSGNCLLGDNATDTTTMHVCVQPGVPLSLGPDIFSCSDSTVSLQPGGPVPPGFNYSWSDGSSGATITVNKAGTYWLEVQNGECSATDSIDVLVQGTPELNTGADKFLCPEDSVLISNNVNEPDVQYRWSNGETGYSQYVKEPGTYTLTATRHDCIVTSTVTVKLLKCPGIYVPTAFTPNHDGRNDIIRPITAGVTLEYFQVYNRWGQLVFQTSASMAGWDGIYNNQLQPASVYVYTVRAIDDTGKRIMKKGTFVLIR